MKQNTHALHLIFTQQVVMLKNSQMYLCCKVCKEDLIIDVHSIYKKFFIWWYILLFCIYKLHSAKYYAVFFHKKLLYYIHLLLSKCQDGFIKLCSFCMEHLRRCLCTAIVCIVPIAQWVYLKFNHFIEL